MQTKVTAILDGLGITYRILPHNEPVFTVEAAAEQRGVPAEQMIKSILLHDKDGHFVLACVTGTSQVDPKAVRALLPGVWKRLSFATGEEIERITGCVLGAIAPLGLPDDVPVVFDAAITRCERVNISSGDPIAGLELEPQDLIRAACARLGQIARAQREIGKEA